MRSVIIEIRKGMVTEVYSDDKDLQFVVVDWDFPESTEPNASQGFIVDPTNFEAMSNETRSLYQRMVS